MKMVCFNGAFVPGDTAVICNDNRSFKYGDGVFETMKMVRGQVPLVDLHMERLGMSVKLLKMAGDDFKPMDLLCDIIHLCVMNECLDLAKIRLAVYRVNDDKPGYIIEVSQPDEDVNAFNVEGLSIDIFPYSRKSCDAYSNIKSANFLPYVLADIHAKENNWDDGVVLNSNNAIADTTKANIFLVKGDELITPALHQGCINGVMRRYIIENSKKHGYEVHQKEVKEADLQDADEVFLTNAVYGMRWVKSFRNKKYGNTKAAEIYKNIVAPLWN
jgi:branched-chain amino acid aminotransferase